MGCVRDPGSEEELATVGKLLGEVDRCREPSETLCHHSPLVNFSLSRPPDCIRPSRSFLPRVTYSAGTQALPNTDDTSQHSLIAPSRGMSRLHVMYLTADSESLPLAISTARVLSRTEQRNQLTVRWGPEIDLIRIDATPQMEMPPIHLLFNGYSHVPGMFHPSPDKLLAFARTSALIIPPPLAKPPCSTFRPFRLTKLRNAGVTKK